MASEESFWFGRRILVTGGCGFIGSHLVEALVERGAEVRVLDAYGVTPRWRRDHIDGSVDLRLGDVADPFFTLNAAIDVDTIFHLAALIGIPYSYIAPGHFVRTNVQGTLAVLEAARAESVRRVVHTSSSEVYGTAQLQPMGEWHPLSAQSPYAATKIGADQLAASYYNSFDVPVTTLRPFNTYGPRQSLRAVLPTLMAQALHSNEILVGSLDPLRDMNFVSDTVAAFLALAETDHVVGEVYNVGSGEARSVGQMLDIVQEVAGTDKPVRVLPERVRPPRSEVGLLLADFSKAHAAFGYSPSVSFRDGLERLKNHLLASAPEELNRYHI
jgi:nucleoside-diphosphate-sugar epimerase